MARLAIRNNPEAEPETEPGNYQVAKADAGEYAGFLAQGEEQGGGEEKGEREEYGD